MTPGPPSAVAYLSGLLGRGRRRVRAAPAHADVVTKAVAVAAWCSAGLLGVFVARLVRAGTVEHQSVHRSPALSYALSLTMIFLLGGPLVIGYGRLVVADLAAQAAHTPLWQWLSRWHAALVISMWGLATLLALRATSSLSRSIWPMPDGNWVDTLAYRLGCSGVILLCAEGIFQSAIFLTLARTFVIGRGGEATLVQRCLDQAETRGFDRAHSYAAWGFSGLGALQAPIMLVLVPHLPTSSAIAACVFIVALVGIGPLLFQLPRVWQRHALEEELDRRLGGALEQRRQPGPDEVALVRVYEHVMGRLQGRGVALTLPPLALAALLKFDAVRKVVEGLSATGIHHP